MMAELRSDKAVDKGNFNDRRRSALDSFMTDLRRRLCGGLEEFVTHLQGQKVISQSDWQDIERSYKTDKARIFHLLNDVLVYKDGSWREILVFLYNANCSDLAGKLQSAAGERTVNLTSSAGKLTVETSLPTGEPQQLVQSSINVEWRQFVRDVVAFNLGDYRAVESFDIDGDSVPIESVWVDLELESSERKFFSDYKEIFDHMGEKMCRLAIVRGQPGSGKTTLAKKIAYDWGKEKLKGFDLVLAVPLRDVQSKSDLLEMAVRIHVANDDDIKRICADLRREKLKILIVLDGLDEFQIPPDSPLSKIFGSGLSGVNVVSASPIRFDFDLIVTSRPFACQLIHENIMTVKYDLVGFTEERKLEFVAKRCKTQGGKAKAIEYLNHTNCLKEVAQNPLLLALMCFLCDRGEPIPSTLTQLFATFVRRMLIRAAQKNAAGKDFHPPIWQKSELLKCLSSLALLGVIKCQFLFSWEDMDTCHIGKEHFHSGLIHYRSDPVGFVSKCYFPHRSIQDFLAAFYTVYYWGNKTLSGSTGWSTDIWPSNLVDIIPLMKVELLMTRLLTTDSQFCHFLFGLASGRTDVSCLSLLRALLDEIVDFYAISPLDLIVFLGDDVADCSDEEHFAAGRVCNEKIDLINGHHLLHPSPMQSKKLFFAKWKGVSRRVRKGTASVVLGKLTKQFRSGLKQTRLNDLTISFAVGTDDSLHLKVLCLQVDAENFQNAIGKAKQFDRVGCVILHLASSKLENTSAVLHVLTQFPTVEQLEVHKVGRTQPTVLVVGIDAQNGDAPKSCTLMSIRMYVTTEIAKTVIQDLRSANYLEPSKIEIVSDAQTGLDQCVVIRVSNDMTNLDLWTFVSGGSWIHDVIESRIITMKSKSILEPFEQVLPEIISRIKTAPTFTLQRECLKLIRSEDFWPQNITELSAQLKEDLVETMLIGLQSNISATLVWEYARTLSDLAVASDLIHKYVKTVEILLRIISNPEITITTRRETMWLLGGIMAESNENRRNLVGQMGVVEQICEVIRQQLNNPIYDRILLFSWNCLTNLYVGSVENMNFISASGVEIFHLCYEKFGDEVEMVEEMMEMMSHLSWFSSVRPQLLSQRNLVVFWQILLKSNDNVAISYRCVYTFANFLSDSTTVWPLDSPTAEEAKNLLIETINKWKLNAQIKLNSCSFKLYLDRIKLHKSPLTDLLLTWRIANLTIVDAPKYCRMLSEAGGVEILTTEVIRHSNSSSDAIRLASNAVKNIINQVVRKRNPLDEDPDNIDQLMTQLTEEMEVLPFTHLLPKILSVLSIDQSSTRNQLECIQLIQTFLPQNLSELTVELKANLVEMMLTCLQSNFNDESIVDCCTDLLAKLEIFADPIDKYTKTVEILLKIVSNLELTTKTKSDTIWLLTEIFMKSGENRRNLVGQMGGVELICELIRQQLNNSTYDRIFLHSWLCLQNLCIDSFENQRKFLSAGGVNLFHLCYEKFGDEVEMVGKMMTMMWILSSNSSEMPQLVSTRNFDVFWQIMLKFNDNVAISWRCAAIFSIFLSDSTIICPLDSPTVERAENRLIGMINKWKLNAQIDFEPDSFDLYLNEVKRHKSPFVDLLWIWTIANLTTIDAPKYCRMLREAGGVEILTTEVIRHSNSSSDAIRLASNAVKNIINQVVRKRNPLDEDPDNIDQLMTQLTEEMKVLPFTHLLPKILSVLSIDQSSTRNQLECIQLIQTFLPQNLSELTVELKANLVEMMLTCLQSNFNDESIVDCCTDLLAKLEIFADPIDKYTKTVEILLKIVSNLELTTKTRSDTIWLLTEIFMKSGENRRNLVGQMGGVELICELIRQQLNNSTYDRILQFGWSCVANLCIGSLENKTIFLSAGGIDLFHLCYEKFGDKVEMVERMMGVMWNLTVFASVRPQLVSKRNFEVFWKILLKFNDNVAISYRCVVTFDNFLSYSTLIWPLDSPTVEEAKNLLIETINKWKLNAQIDINASTFKPRLDQLKLHKSILNDQLLIWTIAHLTTVDAPKYCRMLRDEGGVEILTTEVIRHSNSSLEAVVLAKKAIDNVNKWAKSAV